MISLFRVEAKAKSMEIGKELACGQYMECAEALNKIEKVPGAFL